VKSVTLKILLVEDNVAVAEGLRALLDELGTVSRVATAPTRVDAMKLARSDHFDLAILDYLLPDSTGLEVASELRHIDPHIRMVVLSVVERSGREAGLLKLGVERWFTKSDSLSELISYIQRLSGN